MVSSIYKIPLLAVQIHYARVATKPPNPAPTSEERKRHTKGNRIPELLPDYASGKHFRYPFYLFTVAEAAMILLATAAAPFPSISRVIHWSSTLDVNDIHLSNAYLLGLLLIVAGGSIRASCYRHLGHLFTYQLSVKRDHRLVTDGPYSVVRHPSYVGSCLFFVGAICVQLGPGSWLTANGVWEAPLGWIVVALDLWYAAYTCVFLITRVANEDAVMKQQFGQPWESWAKRTPYRLVPYVY